MTHIRLPCHDLMAPLLAVNIQDCLGSLRVVVTFMDVKTGVLCGYSLSERNYAIIILPHIPKGVSLGVN